MAHLHSVYDTDKHFIIDPITRAIDNQSDKIKLMRGDHNSERFTFEIPKLVEGHDMTLCDSVEIHYINIDALTKSTSADVYPTDDVQISPDSDDVVVFSWLLSGNTTKYAGTLNFRVSFKCHASDSTVEYAWHTDIYKGITVSDGINNTEAVAEEYSDVLEAWRQEITEGITDYNELENRPIKNITSSDDNMVALRDLESGVYRLSGAFTPFIGSNLYWWFTEGQLVNVITKTSGTHIQIFYPIDNTVQFVSIMSDETADAGYTCENINVNLNDLQKLLSPQLSVQLADTSTGTVYSLAITDGKLTMKEI